MIAATDFRNAMSLLTSAVNVVTTSGASGDHGLTVSAVCSVSDSPASLLVCINQSSRSHDDFIQNKVLSVNVLAAQHEHLSNAFASSKFSAEERFKLGTWTRLKTGSPVLNDALVSFDCEVEHIQQMGTHSVLICRVVAIQQGQVEQSDLAQEGLVYFNRAYHQVGQPEIV